jgi:hypothetical protein
VVEAVEECAKMDEGVFEAGAIDMEEEDEAEAVAMDGICKSQFASLGCC